MNLDDLVEDTFLSNVLAGHTYAAWITLAVTWLVLAAILVLVHRIVSHHVRRLSQRTANRLDDILSELLQRTRRYFLVALGLYLALQLLDMEGAGADFVGSVVFLMLMLQVGIWLNSLITLWVEHFRTQKIETDAAAVTTVSAIGFIGRMAVWFVALLIVLGTFGVEITPLIATAGVGGIAIALAVQNILGDLFASLSIVLDKPFVVGDFLIMGEFLGTVEHIGLKTTRLRSLSGEQIIFSNGDLLSSRIRNYKRMFERRVLFGVGVTYQTQYDAVQRIPEMLKEIVESQDRVRFDRAHFKEFGNFSLNFEVVYYVLVPEYNTYMDIQQAINLAVYRRFEDEGIEFAYPTQTLFVTKPELTAIEARPGATPAG